MHLHRAYVLAADDYAKYVGTLERQQALLLATTIDSIVDNDLTHGSGTLFEDVKIEEVKKFISEHERQRKRRAALRDMFATSLQQWLFGAPTKIVERASLVHPEKDFGKYYVPYCRCLTRLADSAASREIIQSSFDDPYARKYVYKTEGTQASWSLVSSFLLPGLEVIKDISPLILKSEAVPKDFILRAIGDPHSYFTHENGVWEDHLVYDQDVLVQTWDVAKTEEMPWKGALAKAGTAIEVINAALKVKKLVDVFGAGSEEEKLKVAFEAISEAFALGGALREAFEEENEEAIGTQALSASKLAFIGAVIDLALGVAEMNEAAEKDAPDAARNAAISLGGKAAITVGLYLAMVGTPGAPVLVLAGLLVSLLSGLLGSESDLDLVLMHCAWGTRYGEGSDEAVPEFARKAYPEWKGNYGEQFFALVQVICKYDIEKPDRGKLFVEGGRGDRAILKMGALPKGSKLTIQYNEEWESPYAIENSRLLAETFTWDGKAFRMKPGSSLLVQPSSEEDGTWEVMPMFPSKLPVLEPLSGGLEGMRTWSSKLKQIQFIGELVIPNGRETIAVPHGERPYVYCDVY